MTDHDAPPRANGYLVRLITDPAILRGCEDLQMQIWQMPPNEIVPLTQLVAAVHGGGSVLGAFGPDGELVGFAYAFPGLRPDGAMWYSHMAGVLPAHQGKGLGVRLKAAQREAALAAGIDHIVWTYDPLQAGNARFNFGRLGTVARRYRVDYYGVMTDGINRGLPSDRFEVDWHLRSARVAARLSGQAPPAPPAQLPWAIQAADPGDPLSVPGEPDVAASGPGVLIEIPPSLARLKAERPDAALRWREATRAALQHFFARGYAVTEAVRFPDPAARRVVYVLSQQEAVS